MPTGIFDVLPLVSGGCLALGVSNQILLSHGPKLHNWWWKLWGCSKIGLYKNNLVNEKEWIMLLEFLHFHSLKKKSGNNLSTILVQFNISFNSQSKIIEFEIPSEPFQVQVNSEVYQVDPCIINGSFIGFDFWTIRYGLFSSGTHNLAFGNMKNMLNLAKTTEYARERLNKYFVSKQQQQQYYPSPSSPVPIPNNECKRSSTKPSSTSTTGSTNTVNIGGSTDRSGQSRSFDICANYGFAELHNRHHHQHQPQHQPQDEPQDEPQDQ